MLSPLDDVSMAAPRASSAQPIETRLNVSVPERVQPEVAMRFLSNLIYAGSERRVAIGEFLHVAFVPSVQLSAEAFKRRQGAFGEKQGSNVYVTIDLPLSLIVRLLRSLLPFRAGWTVENVVVNRVSERLRHYVKAVQHVNVGIVAPVKVTLRSIPAQRDPCCCQSTQQYETTVSEEFQHLTSEAPSPAEMKARSLRNWESLN